MVLLFYSFIFCGNKINHKLFRMSAKYIFINPENLRPFKNRVFYIIVESQI